MTDSMQTDFVFFLFQSLFPEDETKHICASQTMCMTVQNKKQLDTLYQLTEMQNQPPPEQDRCVAFLVTTMEDITFDRTGFPPS